MSGCLRRPILVALLILAPSLLAGPRADAAIIWRANWRLEGYVGQAPAGIKPEAHIVLLYDGKGYPFDLTKAVVTAGRVPKGQLLGDLEHHQMKLQLRGKAKVLDGLRNASPGAKLVIVGHHDTGSGDLQVTKISAGAADAAPAAK